MRTCWLACAIAVCLTPSLARADEQAAAPEIWETEQFKQAFLGTYGVHPDVEPRIGPEDRKVLEQVYPLLSSDPQQAEQVLNEARTPTSTALFDFILGNLAFQDDRMEQAEKHYRDAVTRFPSFRRSWRNLGLIQAQDRRYDEAIDSFTKMIALGGGDAISLGLLAGAHLAKSDYLAAEAAYRQALLLEPENAQWRLGLARSVIKQEKFEEVVALLGVLIAREPERTEFWLLQANAYLGMGQPLRAAENLELVALLGRATPQSFLLLGDIYLNEGHVELASSAYLRGLDLDPTQPVAQPLRAAEALAARGAMAPAGAVSAAIRANLSSELTAEDELRLGKLDARIAVAKGDGGEAVRILEEVLARDPLDGDALLLVGQHHADNGDPDRALVYYERAGGIEGFEAQAKLREAQLLVAAAKYDQAVPLLRRVMELKPREQVARYAEQVERLARAQVNRASRTN